MNLYIAPNHQSKSEQMMMMMQKYTYILHIFVIYLVARFEMNGCVIVELNAPAVVGLRMYATKLILRQKKREEKTSILPQISLIARNNPARSEQQAWMHNSAGRYVSFSFWLF